MAPVDPADNRAVSGPEILDGDVTVAACEGDVLTTDRRGVVVRQSRFEADAPLRVPAADLDPLPLVEEKAELFGAVKEHDELGGGGSRLADHQRTFTARTHELLGLIVEARKLRQEVGPQLREETQAILTAEERLGGTADDTLSTKATGLELCALLPTRQPLMRVHSHVTAKQSDRPVGTRFPADEAFD